MPPAGEIRPRDVVSTGSSVWASTGELLSLSVATSALLRPRSSLHMALTFLECSTRIDDDCGGAGGAAATCDGPPPLLLSFLLPFPFVVPAAMPFPAPRRTPRARAPDFIDICSDSHSLPRACRPRQASGARSKSLPTTPMNSKTKKKNRKQNAHCRPIENSERDTQTHKHTQTQIERR